MKRCLISVILFVLLCTAAFAQTSVTLAWDANTETNLGGYKVYWGTASRVYGAPVTLGKVTTYKLTGLPCGVSLYFAVTAIDNGTPPMESGYSNEPTVRLLCAPTGLKITATSVAAVQRKEATLVASTNLPATTTLAYSIGGAWYAVRVDEAAALEHRITLTNLRPHTQYRYRWSAITEDGATDATEIQSFMTR